MNHLLKRILGVSLLLLISVAMTAQTRTVNGSIKDKNGNPVIDAVVSVQGTSTVTATDDDGNYTIDVPEGTTSLLVKAFGSPAKIFDITGSGPQDFVMDIAVQTFDEAVVTALGIKREKRAIGYSAPSVNSEELDAGGSFSPINALTGKVAGVNILGSGNGPNSSSRIVLRGESSFTKNNQPIFVIDGVPVLNTGSTGGLSTTDFGNRANDVNPDDIASVTVLKGPAAAALYGSDGMFGAIIITTKSGSKGQKNKGTTTFSSSYTFSNVLKLPTFQNQYGEGYLSGGERVIDLKENWSWGPEFDGATRPWGQEINGKQRFKPYKAIPDNVKNFFNTGGSFENNLGFNRTVGKSDFYLGLNTRNYKGVIPNTYNDKYAVRFNVGTELSDRLTSKVGINYVNQDARTDATGQSNRSVYNNVIQQPRDIPITELKDLDNIFNSMSVYDAQGIERYGYYGAYTFNPYWVAENYFYTQSLSRLLGTVQLDYKLAEHWTLTERFGGDVYTDTRISKEPKINSIAFDEVDNGYLDDWTGNDHSEPGQYAEGISRYRQFNNDLILQYNRQINNNLHIGGLAGYNAFFRDRNATSASTSGGLVVPGFYNLSNSAGNVIADNDYQTKRKQGLYGAVNLNYRERLFAEITARNDWSTAFGPSNRSYFYPGINAAWIFTESFPSWDRIFSFGKIRSSWASVGSDLDWSYNVLPAGYSSPTINGGFGSTTFPFDGTPGFSYSNVAPNPDLRPERVNEFEIGTELGFLKDRITVDFTWYNKNSYDLLTLAFTSAASGATAAWKNVGQIQNKGIELAMNFVPYKNATNTTVWELFGTYTKNKSLVIRTDAENAFIGSGGYSGMAIGAIPGMPFGVFQTQYLLEDGNGQVIVDSTSGLPFVNPEATTIHSFQPKFLASWGTSLKVKNFFFKVLFDTRQGNYFYSRTKDIMDFVGTANETVWNGSRADQVFPNSVKYASDGSLVPNDIPMDLQDYYTSVIPAGSHVINGSFIKLREASMTYNFKNVADRVKWLNGMSLAIFGNNLAIWTHKDNQFADPEVNSNGSSNSQGFDFSAAPSLRNYGIKLNLNL